MQQPQTRPINPKPFLQINLQSVLRANPHPRLNIEISLYDRSNDESFETIIAKSTEIHGQIVATQSLRIDGSVKGDIRGSQGDGVSVAIGLTGSVHGNIHAQRLIVGGKIIGNVFVTDTAELHDTADVQGDITYSQISIEPGAKGNGRMVSQANAQQGELTTEGQPTLVNAGANQALPAPAAD